MNKWQEFFPFMILGHVWCSLTFYLILFLSTCVLVQISSAAHDVERTSETVDVDSRTSSSTQVRHPSPSGSLALV